MSTQQVSDQLSASLKPEPGRGDPRVKGLHFSLCLVSGGLYLKIQGNTGTFVLVSRAATCRGSAVCSLVRLEGAVDRAVLRRRVGEVGAALPPGLGEDPVEEAGGAVSRCGGGPPCGGGPVESQRPLDAVSSQQFRSTATTAGQKKSGGSDFVPEPPIILLFENSTLLSTLCQEEPDRHC